jgi:hypothetical protein
MRRTLEGTREATQGNGSPLQAGQPRGGASQPHSMVERGLLFVLSSNSFLIPKNQFLGEETNRRRRRTQIMGKGGIGLRPTP